MTDGEFWARVAATRDADPDTHAERLTARLAELPEGERLDFVHWWGVVDCRAYRRDLWGTAYLINGGCSDDGFDYFRDWLILQGRAVYEAAIADADTLAEVRDGEDAVECECRPGPDAWFAATGTEPDEEGSDAYSRALMFRHAKPPSKPPLAPGWDFDDHDEVRRRLPRLAAIYLPPDEENNP